MGVLYALWILCLSKPAKCPLICLADLGVINRGTEGNREKAPVIMLFEREPLETNEERKKERNCERKK